MSVLSVVLFCACCFGLLQALRQPVSIFDFKRTQAIVSLRIAKVYKVAAWSTMTMVFWASLVISFYEVFTKM
ncbi:MAG: hypothetical protein ACOYOK_05970 [Pseudobdellovibrionaceae bacterium]